VVKCLLVLNHPFRVLLIGGTPAIPLRIESTASWYWPIAFCVRPMFIRRNGSVYQ
jgi:hypothetical protein